MSAVALELQGRFGLSPEGAARVAAWHEECARQERERANAGLLNRVVLWVTMEADRAGSKARAVALALALRERVARNKVLVADAAEAAALLGVRPETMAFHVEQAEAWMAADAAQLETFL
jgi:hypothetical protein